VSNSSQHIGIKDISGKLQLTIRVDLIFINEFEINMETSKPVQRMNLKTFSKDDEITSSSNSCQRRTNSIKGLRLYMISNMRIIPLNEMESLAQRANDYCKRYDIPEEAYQGLLTEQEAYYEFLQKNPSCYYSKNDWEKALTHNRFICLMLMLRLLSH
jgi:hypothetical protein